MPHLFLETSADIITGSNCTGLEGANAIVTCKENEDVGM